MTAMFCAIDGEGTVWETGSLSECQEFAKKYSNIALSLQELLSFWVAE